jgi:hypothetical protein
MHSSTGGNGTATARSRGRFLEADPAVLGALPTFKWSINPTQCVTAAGGDVCRYDANDWYTGVLASSLRMISAI